MQTLTIDFETFYSSDYTLKKMPTLLYIRDPRFKAHGCSVKEDENDTIWIPAAKLTEYFDSVPWEEIDVISHNSNFDLSVLYEHWRKSPGRRIDTVGLCRALLPRDLNFDLNTIGPLLGIHGKIDSGAALKDAKGVRDLTPEQESYLGEYAIGDSDICHGIYKKLWPLLPEFERDFMDLILRISTEGSFIFDPSLAGEVEEAIKTDRLNKLKATGLSVDDDGKVTQLNSRDKFADLLRSKGVEPPTKISPRTGQTTYAFSKQDPDFLALQDNPEVADLIKAKLVWASNTAITRAQSLAKCGTLADGSIPVFLNYSGAHTHRLSGGGGINAQNLPARGPTAKLRKAFKAPDGHLVLVRDSSQIELRVNMMFSGQKDIIEILREGGDPYKRMAAALYSRPEAEIENPSPERSFAKVVELGAGFGMGPPKFRATCATGPMGADPIYLTRGEAATAIYTYRDTHPFVKNSWDWLGNQGVVLMATKDSEHQRGPVIFKHESIELPGGLTLKYPDLTPTEDGWIWGINGVVHRTYGGILQENIVQSLAAVIIKEMMLAADKALRARGWGKVVHQVHDEIICLIREEHVEKADKLLQQIMNAPPSWWPGLPLDSEGSWGPTYGDCK